MTAIKTFPSNSNPTQEHTVSMADNGTLFCTCRGWKYQKVAAEHRDCTHTREVKQAMAAPTVAR